MKREELKALATLGLVEGGIVPERDRIRSFSGSNVMRTQAMVGGAPDPCAKATFDQEACVAQIQAGLAHVASDDAQMTQTVAKASESGVTATDVASVAVPAVGLGINATGKADQVNAAVEKMGEDVASSAKQAADTALGFGAAGPVGMLASSLPWYAKLGIGSALAGAAVLGWKAVKNSAAARVGK